jgi:uncharacterized protein Yka (UPF0111/DUF47 family)
VPLRFRFLPRNESFYQEFIALSEELRRGARLLEDMLVQIPVWDKADEIMEVEHKCDVLTHQIIQVKEPNLGRRRRRTHACHR